MSKLLYYAAQPKILLLGLLLLLALFILYRLIHGKYRRTGGAKARVASQKGFLRLNLDQDSSPPASQEASPNPEPQEALSPNFKILQKPPSLSSDLLHGILILLSIIVAAGFIIVLIPQARFSQMTESLQERRTGAKQESLGFLYLGDETKEQEFHIRGAVRNITDRPLEQVDAAIRIYAPDGRLQQTYVIRMDKETIAPDEIAEFHLVYPNYQQNIGSYSVDFRSRQGLAIFHKDMRAAAQPKDGLKTQP